MDFSLLFTPSMCTILVYNANHYVTIIGRYDTNANDANIKCERMYSHIFVSFALLNLKTKRNHRIRIIGIGYNFNDGWIVTKFVSFQKSILIKIMSNVLHSGDKIILMCWSKYSNLPVVRKKPYHFKITLVEKKLYYWFNLITLLNENRI